MSGLSSFIGGPIANPTDFGFVGGLMFEWIGISLLWNWATSLLFGIIFPFYVGIRSRGGVYHVLIECFPWLLSHHAFPTTPFFASPSRLLIVSAEIWPQYRGFLWIVVIWYQFVVVVRYQWIDSLQQPSRLCLSIVTRSVSFVAHEKHALFLPTLSYVVRDGLLSSAANDPWWPLLIYTVAYPGSHLIIGFQPHN